MLDISPVILFVYNRPHHTRRTLLALENNVLAKDSILYIYSDAAKTAEDVDSVNNVRAIIREPRKFKRVEIVERKTNLGLAESIIQGVSEIIKTYKKAIVFEDDLESSPFALTYFNDALERYKNESRVMHISGYNYPLHNHEHIPESFFFRVPGSWGWATWSRAWLHFETDINALTQDFSKANIHQFSIEGKENFWKQVKEFKAGKINSWAIRWYLTIFNRNGLALYPRDSMIQNIGTDGTGTHSDIDKAYLVTTASKKVEYFPAEIIESRAAYEAIKYFYSHRKGSLLKRAIRFIRKQIHK